MIKDIAFFILNVLLLAIPTIVIIHVIKNKSKTNNNPPEE